MVAWKTDSIFSTVPAAAVPVSVKMPETITAPTPSAVRLDGPSDFLRRCSGSSDAAISASILLVRKSWEGTRSGRLLPLPLALSLNEFLDLLLHGATGDTRCPFGLGSG